MAHGSLAGFTFPYFYLTCTLWLDWAGPPASPDKAHSGSAFGPFLSLIFSLICISLVLHPLLLSLPLGLIVRNGYLSESLINIMAR